MLAMPPILTITRWMTRIRKQCRVERRHKRRALSSCRNVATPEISHYSDIRAFRNPRRIVDLRRPSLFRPVSHRLTMNAGRNQVVQLDT